MRCADVVWMAGFRPWDSPEIGEAGEHVDGLCQLGRAGVANLVTEEAAEGGKCLKAARRVVDDTPSVFWWVLAGTPTCSLQLRAHTLLQNRCRPKKRIGVCGRGMEGGARVVGPT